jgi:ABC-type transport system involved in cytochrome c biogenesis permease subunit
MTTLRTKKLVPWLAGLLALAAAAVSVVPPAQVRGYDLESFGRLPVLEGGRVKPLDSVARNTLLVIRGTQAFAHEGRTVGPREWLLEVMFRPDVADQMAVFQIDDPEVLGLIRQPQTQRRFSFQAIAPYLAEIERQAQPVEQIEAARRTRFQAAVLNLYERIYLYHRLRNSIQLSGSPGLVIELASLGTPTAGQRHAVLSQLAYFRPIPPGPGKPPEAWRNTGEALRAAASGEAEPALAEWGRLGIAWAGQDPGTFGRAVAALAASANAATPRAPGIANVGYELAFNRAQPFYTGIVIYVLAMLLVFASWLKYAEVLRPAAYGLLCAGAVVHTLGLVARVIIQGYAPVTNLYSSAVFVGWAIIALGLVIERMYRKGFATAIAAACGVSTLIIAHHLSMDGDTMEMMRAVLDSNFWLGTHVITITIGYAGTFLAGAIAIGWVLRERLVRRRDRETSTALSKGVYGVICFALFFSFLGTVLGGIWADQSWGRFWGWDPKENGALLIVLWNAIILHARWGGFARERGIMAMAIFGNVITALSWFGVNMLGVGLHSYGFMDKAFFALAGFCASQLVFIGLAYAPARGAEVVAEQRAARRDATETAPS